MSADFCVRQSSAHDEITRELIQAVPPDWDSAILEMDLFRTCGGECCSHMIYHPQGGGGVVAPSDGLLAAMDRLVLLMKEDEVGWRRATFGVWRAGDCGWQSTVQVS